MLDLSNLSYDSHSNIQKVNPLIFTLNSQPYIPWNRDLNLWLTLSWITLLPPYPIFLTNLSTDPWYFSLLTCWSALSSISWSELETESASALTSIFSSATSSGCSSGLDSGSELDSDLESELESEPSLLCDSLSLPFWESFLLVSLVSGTNFFSSLSLRSCSRANSLPGVSL